MSVFDISRSMEVKLYRENAPEQELKRCACGAVPLSLERIFIRIYFSIFIKVCPKFPFPSVFGDFLINTYK